MRNLVKDLLKIEEIDNLNIDNLIKKKCGQDCLPEIYKKSRSYVRQRIIDESYKNSIDSKSYMILKEEVGKLLLINQEKE